MHNLLNFEYSLLNNKGELLKFADGEDKIPSLNFLYKVLFEMLKVKKKIHKKNKNLQDDENLKNQNDLKNPIKNLYISNQTKKKAIDEYAQLTTKIREEYSNLQSKCNH